MTAVSTLSTSLPVEPWRVDALQPRIHEAITPRSIRAYAYSLRLSSVEQLTKDILHKGFTEYFYAAIEVTANIITPNSSDYAPYAISSIVLKVCGRKGKEEIEVIRLLLAQVEMPENDRPTPETIRVLREQAEAILNADSALTRWWKQLIASMPLAADQVKEDARTEKILHLMTEARESILSKRYENPKKGMIVRVVRGRKVPIGTEGKLIWVGSTKFGKRVGFNDLSDTTHWTAWNNIEFIDPVDEKQVIEIAKQYYTEGGWGTIFGTVRT
jgi:hypothetical protein